MIHSHNIFLSHAAADQSYAIQLRDLLAKAIPGAKIFCSSDSRDIEGGRTWFNEVVQAANSATVLIALLTPNSIFKHWLIFEAGVTYARAAQSPSSYRVFPVTAKGINVSSLPGPLSHLQSKDLTSPDNVRALIQEVASLLQMPVRNLDAVDVEIFTEAAKSEKLWHHVTQSLLAERIDFSPFVAEELLREGEEQFFAAGQNLYSFAKRGSSFQGKLFDWLARKPSRRASMLLHDLNYPHVTTTWSTIGKTFEQDLRNSTIEYRRWLSDARTRGIQGQLEIRTTELVTMSAIAVDPDMASGRIVLTPILPTRMVTTERPQFCLSRSMNQTAFVHYWDTYRELFDRGNALDYQ